MSLFIDVNAIKDNIMKIKEKTKKEIMAVLKNNAYGVGSKKMLQICYESDVKWVVYNTYQEYLEDKMEIKKLHLKVLLLESINENNINDDYQELRFSVNKLNDLTENILFTKKTLYLHLSIDTGMNRLGIKTIKDVKKIIKICSNSQLIIEGIYTHFASAIDENKYYQQQRIKFKKFINLYPFKIIHAQATQSLHKDEIGNFVRVGMGLYGYHSALPLKPTISYYIKPVNILNLKKGESVGYEQNYHAKKQTQIIVLPIGYYDVRGIDHVTYLKKELPIIGKICMNHMFILNTCKNEMIGLLQVLAKSDIIRKEYNWYQIITSMKQIPKNYMERINYDISAIPQSTKKTPQKYRFRSRSH